MEERGGGRGKVPWDGIWDRIKIKKTISPMLYVSMFPKEFDVSQVLLTNSAFL